VGGNRRNYSLNFLASKSGNDALSWRKIGIEGNLWEGIEGRRGGSPLKIIEKGEGAVYNMVKGVKKFKGNNLSNNWLV
jgi:hypothetical protein